MLSNYRPAIISVFTCLGDYLMADIQGIIFKLLRTAIAALVFGLVYWLLLWIIGVLLTAFHIALPAFVGPILLVILVLAFILVVIKIWGWNWQF
jgi:hypothetical protein